jgi:hypothetical protein
VSECCVSACLCACAARAPRERVPSCISHVRCVGVCVRARARCAAHACMRAWANVQVALHLSMLKAGSLGSRLNLLVSTARKCEAFERESAGVGVAADVVCMACEGLCPWLNSTKVQFLTRLWFRGSLA